MKMRLDKFISLTMNVTRTQAKKVLQRSDIMQDDKIFKRIDDKIDTTKPVLINGKEYFYEEFIYIMMNKPKGVVSVSKDNNDTTVIDLLSDEFKNRNLFSAGRLDKDSTGFVLITDDGKFSHEILSPKKHIEKTYIVTLETQINDDIITAFEEGVVLHDGTQLKPSKLKAVSEDKKIVIVKISQGVYHQIKRMFGVFNIPVIDLKRTHIGNLILDENLKEGEYKKLTKEEVEKIK